MDGKPKYNILYVDDEKHNLSTFRVAFRRFYNVFVALNAFEGLDILKENEIHVIISDQRMDGMSGVEFFKRIKKSHPDGIRIILTGYSDMNIIVRAINECGIFRFMMKPWDEAEMDQTIKNAIELYELRKNNKNLIQQLSEFNARLKEENSYLKEELKNQSGFGDILTVNDQFKVVLKNLEKVAVTNSTCLIQGETGTGKELIARAIYNFSKLSDKPFIKVNCAALPLNLIESELFGHEKGAFTGAIEQRIGRFELADGGTIFLDEIGELSLEIQSKLLRVLQEGEFQRLGGNDTLRVKTRIIVATNRDLKKRVQEGKFREDLFYRLNVFPIKTIPLRNRPEDIEILANHFLTKHRAVLGKEEVCTIDAPNLKKLLSYSWPGNVRELENIIQRYLITTEGNKLDLSSWTPDLSIKSNSKRIVTLEDNERIHIENVLVQTNGKVFGPGGAAEILDINPKTLMSRMSKLGIKKNVR